MEWAHAIRVAGASRDVVVSRACSSAVLVPWRVLCFRRCRKRRTFFGRSGAFGHYYVNYVIAGQTRREYIRVYVCTCVRVCNMQITTYVTIVRMRGAISACAAFRPSRPRVVRVSILRALSLRTCEGTVCTDDLVRWDSALDSASNLHRDIALDSALDTPLLQARGSVVGQDPPPQGCPAMPCRADAVARFWA